MNSIVLAINRFYCFRIWMIIEGLLMVKSSKPIGNA